MKGILTGIAISVLGLLAALLALEGLVRLAVRPPLRWTDRPIFYYRQEGAETLQDYRHADLKSPQTFRISVVGDSYSFAPYMQFTDAFPKQLERMLNLNNSELKAEVINHGVPAYSTSHEVQKVRRAIEQQSDLIILQITLNDPEIKGETPIGIGDIQTKFQPLEFKGFEKTLARYLKTYALVRQRLHNERTRRDYINYFLGLWNNPRSYGSFQKALKEIVRMAGESETRIVAVVFPLFGLPMDDEYPLYAIHERVDRILTELQVPHIDLSPFYRDIPLERLHVMPAENRHPNEIGHRIAAERIYLWLDQNNFIPEPLKIRERFQGRTKIIKEKPWSEEEQPAQAAAIGS